MGTCYKKVIRVCSRSAHATTTGMLHLHLVSAHLIDEDHPRSGQKEAEQAYRITFKNVSNATLKKPHTTSI